MDETERRALSEETARVLGLEEVRQGIPCYRSHRAGFASTDPPDFDSPEIVKAILESVDVLVELAWFPDYGYWKCYLSFDGEKPIRKDCATQFEALARAFVASKGTE